MWKPILILAGLSVLLIAEAMGQQVHIILPTYRPPPQKGPVIRTAREAGEPQWLFKGDIPRAPASGDHPFLPSYIDDIKLDPNRRTARSLSTPKASRGEGTRQPSSKDTGPTHPGYNHRNAREIRLPHLPFDPSPRPLEPFYPRPWNPSPFNPTTDRERFPIYARSRRDLNQEEVLSEFEDGLLLDDQEEFRFKRSVESLASQEYLVDNTGLGELSSQEEFRSKRSVETLASQETTVNLDDLF